MKESNKLKPVYERLYKKTEKKEKQAKEDKTKKNGGENGEKNPNLYFSQIFQNKSTNK